MIPTTLAAFLDRASVAVGATRDAANTPQGRMLAGWAIESDRETMVAVVGRGFTRGLVEALLDNGQMAVTAEVIGPHETYQFKGDYIDSRELTTADLDLSERCRQRFVEGVENTFPGAFTVQQRRSYLAAPALTVRFRVRTVFVQTPGPSAGRRVFPEGEP